jgi:hypothetical protein
MHARWRLDGGDVGVARTPHEGEEQAASVVFRYVGAQLVCGGASHCRVSIASLACAVRADRGSSPHLGCEEERDKLYRWLR